MSCSTGDKVSPSVKSFDNLTTRRTVEKFEIRFLLGPETHIYANVYIQLVPLGYSRLGRLLTVRSPKQISPKLCLIVAEFLL